LHKMMGGDEEYVVKEGSQMEGEEKKRTIN
jgi:hypothetical protein